MGITRSIIIVAMMTINVICFAQDVKGSVNDRNDSSNHHRDRRLRQKKWKLDRRFHLSQNFPNPFSLVDTTRIEYRAVGVPSALLIVYSSNGKEVMTVNLPGEKTNVSISGKQLQPGTYTYALMVHGRIVAKEKFELNP